MTRTELDTDSLRTRLAAAGQEHLLAFAPTLDEDRLAALLEQIASLDLERVPEYVRTYVHATGAGAAGAGTIEPAPYYALADRGEAWDDRAYERAGASIISAGKVAAFTVAGGQGSRLGYDGPKGEYPGGAVTGKPLFRILAEGILAARTRWSCEIPWYIMTSPLNHEATLAFFRGHSYFGLPEDDVVFFQQGVMPSFDRHTGRILLAETDRVATNPDGHGGSLRALTRSGAIDDMRRRGVEHISYCQIDNPIVRVIDPLFVGLHATAPDSSGQMSSKMVVKTDPDEKVGIFAKVDGVLRVVEYSDLSDEDAHRREPDGSLSFKCGSIAIHMLGVEFVASLDDDEAGLALPFHRAVKKVAHVDPETGQRIEPAEPNAVKLEMFVFDALARCRSSIVLETDRIEEFAPIKNATGNDSPKTSARIQTLRAARWIEQAGGSVPKNDAGEPDCTLEISPLTATCARDLVGAALPRIERGSRVAL